MREIHGIDHVVYFSSTTDNTHRFVQKLGVSSTRIPVKINQGIPVMDREYLLITPTYGGGAGMVGENSRPVPPQVRKFLMHEDNHKLMLAVAATGNSNFGVDYGVAGDVISKKFGVPYVFRFELMGTELDVERMQRLLSDIHITIYRERS